MTIASKTTIHYTDDENQDSSEYEEEEINLIDFGPEIDEIKDRLVKFEGEVRDSIEAVEARQMIAM